MASPTSTRAPLNRLEVNHNTAARSQRESLAKRSLWTTAGSLVPVTLATQILSFASSIVLALILGASDQTDAYYLALSIPVTVYTILVAATRLGAIPSLNDFGAGRSTDLDAAAGEVVGAVVVAATGLSLLVTVVSLIAVPAVVGGSVHLIHLTQIMMVVLSPYAVTGALAGALGAVLAVRGLFAATVAVTGIEPIIKSVLVLLFHRQIGVYALIAGNLAGGVLATTVLWGLIRRQGIQLSPRFNPGSDITRSLLMLSGPLMIAQSVLQVNPLIDRGAVAGLSRGSITVLELGLRLFAGPMLLLGGLLITPLAATWSARLAEHGQHALDSSFSRALKALVITVPPFVVAGFIFRHSLVSIFYGGGAYSQSAINGTGTVFGMLLLGLPAQVAIVALSTLFIVHKDAIFPMKVAFINVVLNLTLDLILRGPMGVSGVALGTTITMSLLGLLYLAVACYRWGSLGLEQLLRPVVCACVSVIVLTLCLLTAASVVPVHGSRIVTLAVIVGATAIGCGVHMFVLFVGGVSTMRLLPIPLARKLPSIST